MVLAIFMALGAFRLARHKVLVRRAAVIETLGAATFLCVDKTGTLTENRMVLTTAWRGGEVQDLRGMSGFPALPSSRSGRHCSHPPSARSIPWTGLSACWECGFSPESVWAEAPLRTYPLRPELLAFIQVWPDPVGGVLYAAKGAPEAIFRLCRMGDDERAAMDAVVAGLASRGLRVLGVASARDEHGPRERLPRIWRSGSRA